jgi:hypothetical protein
VIGEAIRHPQPDLRGRWCGDVVIRGIRVIRSDDLACVLVRVVDEEATLVASGQEGQPKEALLAARPDDVGDIEEWSLDELPLAHDPYPSGLLHHEQR